MEHECKIGLLHHTDYDTFITHDGLKNHIHETKYLNGILKSEYGHINGYERLKHKEYTLKDYTDKRKSTNLTRFNYCPDCGKKIDWKAMRKDGK